MNYYNFHEMRKIGEKGVGLVTTALRRQQPPYNLITISRQADRRRAGFDIELVARQSPYATRWRSVKLEVKTDRHDPDNFFLELSRLEAGRLANTPADFLCYLFLKNRRLFVFDMPALERWVRRNHMGFASAPARTPTGNTHFMTDGIIVPVSYLAGMSLSIEQMYDKIVK